MKTEYQYINFELIEEKPKTKVWRCNNNKGNYELGIVKWYPGWRQYCYFPSVQATYSKGCLDDIADFIKGISGINTGVTMISINELAQELIARGYKVTPRTLKFYIDQGLLPKPKKQGGYRKGVRLIYHDREEVLAKLFKIFDLKGRGFKLAEIAQIVKKQEREETSNKHRAYLKRWPPPAIKRESA